MINQGSCHPPGLRFYYWPAVFALHFLSCRHTPQQAPPSREEAATAKPARDARQEAPFPDSGFISFRADPTTQDIRLYWKDEAGQRYATLGNLADQLKQRGSSLLFAANGGMFNPEFGPQGLYIEGGKTLSPVDRGKGGSGNFYLKPNGIFYITRSGKVVVCKTEDFARAKDVAYATQSGPMLLIDGKVHPAFTEGSANTNVRNGVGILPDGRALFIMSTRPVNFFDFAMLFRKEGCRNALYLDGFVSRTYAPAQGWKQTGGDFGVMIGVTAKE